MRFLQQLPALLAEQQDAITPEKASSLPLMIMLAVVVTIIFASFWVGGLINRKMRMPKEGAWRLGLVFCTLLLAALVIWPKPEKYGAGWPPAQGVDLRGGYYLVYEYETAPDDNEDKTPQLIAALSRRLNPSGTSEIVIRKYGPNQIEIIVPEVDQVEIARLKEKITTAGALEFRMVADKKHDDLMDYLDDARNKGKVLVRDDQGKRVGEWMMLGRDINPDNGKLEFTYETRGWETLRDRLTKERITGPVNNDYQGDVEILVYTGNVNYENKTSESDTSVTGDDIRNCFRSTDEINQPCVSFNMKAAGASQMAGLTGSHLPDKSRGFYRHLGIVLDKGLISAPRLETTISDRGRITGNFTNQRVDFLVNIIKAGALPTALKREPLSENQMGALLGQDTINKGKFAIGTSLVAVLIFVVIYYRFCGLVACLALLANLSLIIALMILVKGTFTLPGLAGMVLTVGMSVDANVLIFERIREEINKGSALRMAIRNGFAKATTTIIDANVTTLITAMVLYAIGTDQIRGFAVTLILGILMSMYTAIFCSRVVFDIAERSRRFTSLSMMRILGATSIDFIGKRRVAAVFSIVVISAGLVAVFMRGNSLLDIDFIGGTSVTVELIEPLENRQVRDKLDQMADAEGKKIQYSLNTVSLGSTDNTIWKINTSVGKIDALRDQVMTVFADPKGGSLLRSYKLRYTDVKKVVAEKPADSNEKTGPDAGKKEDQGKAPADPNAGKSDSKAPPTNKGDPKGDEKSPKKQSGNDLRRPYSYVSAPVLSMAAPQDTKKADAKKADTKKADAKKADTKKADTKKADTKKADTKKADTKKADTKKTDTKKTDTKKTDTKKTDTKKADTKKTDAKKADTKKAGESTLPLDPTAKSAIESAPKIDKTRASIVIGDPSDDEDDQRSRIDAPTLSQKVVEAAKALSIELRSEDVELVPDPMPKGVKWTAESSLKYPNWIVTLPTDEATMTKIMDETQTSFSREPVFHSSNSFGEQVSGNMKRMAVEALLASLLGIVAYIWIRFQKVIFGLAAVVALLHDVLVTLGAIAISGYLAGALGLLKIEEFKISLPVVAAFLTIIGYSLNDTIVVFDRIREVRGKSPELTGTMINASINQTLSRTILTSITTLIVVMILYWFGGSGIHGFAFALVVGVIVGTYSSIFVASPVLLWMMRLSREK